MDILHFIYPSIDGHLTYLHLLAVKNNVAINICVKVFVWM